MRTKLSLQGAKSDAIQRKGRVNAQTELAGFVRPFWKSKVFIALKSHTGRKAEKPTFI